LRYETVSIQFLGGNAIGITTSRTLGEIQTESEPGFRASLNHSNALDLREDYRQMVFEMSRNLIEPYFSFHAL
jgi:hypothetical protein